MGDPLHAHGGRLSVRGAYTLQRRAVLAGVLLAPAACATGDTEAQAPARRFVYDDLHRYNGAVAAIEAGADPAATLQAYLDDASDGMQTWLSVYPATADELAERLAQRPRYYASLREMPARMAPFEPEIARAYARLEAMAPGSDLGAVYYLVGKRSAGGTARQQGTFLAVEFFGLTESTDLREFGGRADVYDTNEMVQVAVHEGAHNVQRHLQTEPNFISIYVNPERMTLRNFAIREGVADYVTYELTGRRFEARHAFAEPREAEIWAEFQPIMHETIFAQPGWFTAGFADGRDWPIQVGYFVGFKMAEHIHRGAVDRDAALRELMSPHTDDQFAAIAARYAEKFS